MRIEYFLIYRCIEEIINSYNSLCFIKGNKKIGMVLAINNYQLKDLKKKCLISRIVRKNEKTTADITPVCCHWRSCAN